MLTFRYLFLLCGDCVHVSEEVHEKCKRDGTTITTQSEPNVVNTMLDKVQEELSIRKKVIKCTEMTCKTLRKLLSGNDEIIAQQKIIINSCKSVDQKEELTTLRTKLDDVNRNIDESNNS